MTQTGTPKSTWRSTEHGGLARTIRKVTGLDTQTASEIADYAAEHGQVAFMTATVLLLDKDDVVPHPAPGRGLARWVAYGGSECYLALMARET